MHLDEVSLGLTAAAVLVVFERQQHARSTAKHREDMMEKRL
jgi:hypothetical protein